MSGENQSYSLANHSYLDYVHFPFPCPISVSSTTTSHCFLTILSLSMTSPILALFHKSFPNLSDAFINLTRKNKKQSTGITERSHPPWKHQLCPGFHIGFLCGSVLNTSPMRSGRNSTEHMGASPMTPVTRET